MGGIGLVLLHRVAHGEESAGGEQTGRLPDLDHGGDEESGGGGGMLQIDRPSCPAVTGYDHPVSGRPDDLVEVLAEGDEGGGTAAGILEEKQKGVVSRIPADSRIRVDRQSRLRLRPDDRKNRAQRDGNRAGCAKGNGGASEKTEDWDQGLQLTFSIWFLAQD